jgi:hypothetical protein
VIDAIAIAFIGSSSSARPASHFRVFRAESISFRAFRGALIFFVRPSCSRAFVVRVGEVSVLIGCAL